ncbi:PSD1 and planctomycete cytochrome C domain-containing protein [Gimesia algae]|uniref:Planctomycete cytochrome C n=1 Tax=Gimesia algae TaxID=2527971 RepID=A0A517VF96_9PLAN|nr:PSD1 and planctomycete cytochrome C domain-containing protein [Gimesia algae]QDT91690.1 Planctomycete cytochrome C [Gimesia algae]
MRYSVTAISLILLTIFQNPLNAESAPVVIDYQTQIKPLLKSNCFACHGSLKQESALRLDAGKLILKGGEIGPAIVSGKPEESLLYQVLTPEADFQMPPEGLGRRLKPDEVQLIKNWIAQGAKYPTGDQPEADPAEHWAFQPVIRPDLPAVKTKSLNPIDAFIASRLEQSKVIPQPQADKITLLRRVYLDLIGLPPTPAELDAYLSDARPDAWNRVIEDLLARPQYGERWGRHWMDVWRYSDWYGRRGAKDMTNSYSLTWRWRDWIIRSINEDKGYDRMILEMLAADEIAPNDRENLVATGFIVRNFYRWNYHTWLKDNVEHTGKAFLGLTMNCCECHDHKYDPITQNEYFAFRSFFEPVDLRHDRVPGEADPGIFPDYKLSVRNGPIRTGMVRIYDRHLDAKAKFYTGGLEQNVVKDKPPVEASAIAFLGGDKLDFKPVQLPPTAWYPGLKPFVIQEETQKRETAYQSALKNWEQQKTQLKQEIKQHESALANVLSARPENTATAENDPTRLSSSVNNQQALQLNAEQGRRTLSYEITDWKAFDSEIQIRFQLRILKDAHVNFQLSNDLTGGRTNLYVAFEAGKIIAYVPGTTNPTTVGAYKNDSSDLEFNITLHLKPDQDLAQLSIHGAETNDPILKETTIALNGWNPALQANRGLFLDAHQGSIAEFDQILFLNQNKQELLHCDFEFPAYQSGEDLPGIANWQLTRFSTGPATSQVILKSTLTEADHKWQQQVKANQLKRDITKATQIELQLKLQAAEAEKTEYSARVRAATARYIEKAKNAGSLEQVASQAEWQAKLIRAQSNLKSADLALLQVKTLPDSDQERAKKLSAAQTQVTQSRAQLKTAQKPVESTSTKYTALSRIFPEESTGKRTALARWITSRANPLTARVAVNHIWMRHFGKPLVNSVYNFGRSGAEPTHPELINWLATEFMDHNWSIKHLHRVILTSETYQRSSKGVPAEHSNLTHDQDNILLWKFPTNRMEAEVVRDSIFYLAGDLDPTMYGQELEQDQGLITNRRSLYYSHHGEAKMEFLELFDGASATDCYQRTTTVMPQQALALTNSKLAVQKGRMIAEQLWSQSASDQSTDQKRDTFINSAFRLVLSRPASEKELTTAVTFLSRQQALYPPEKTKSESTDTKRDYSQPAVSPAARARESLVHALLSHNDFVTIR